MFLELGKSKVGSQLIKENRRKGKRMLHGHVFICLSKRNQESVPDSEERMMLQLSGLGEQKITFCLDVDNQEIYDEILSTFPS